MPDKYACNKTGFETPEEAAIRLHEIKNNPYDRRETIPIRFYQCSKCELYHLTSKSLEEFERNTRKGKNKRRKLYSRVRQEAEYWLRRFRIKDDV